jgi:hypothetical protein
MQVMSDGPAAPDKATDELAALRERTEYLERELMEVRQSAQSQLAQAELKAQAIRAGMIDLDGLKLIDFSGMAFDGNGNILDAASFMDKFKMEKPWLFNGASSSTSATVPPPPAPRGKLATEMSDAEYRVARAAILKQRNYS